MCGHAIQALFTYYLSSLSRYANCIRYLDFGLLLRVTQNNFPLPFQRDESIFIYQLLFLFLSKAWTFRKSEISVWYPFFIVSIVQRRIDSIFKTICVVVFPAIPYFRQNQQTMMPLLASLVVHLASPSPFFFRPYVLNWCRKSNQIF